MEVAPKSVLVLLTLCLRVLHGWSRRELYVQPDTSVSCPQEPCLSLSKYAENSTRYFTSGAAFLFLDGEHALSTSVMLFNVTGITLSGLGTGARARVSLSSEANISWSGSSGIVLSSLEITYQGKANNSLNSALFFTSSEVEIRNVELAGSNMDRNRSRAVSFFRSTAMLANCSFSGGYNENGGAILTEDSNLTFSGANVFVDNTADISGGCIYSSSSMLTFTGNNTFLNNRATMLLTSVVSGGGAVFITQGSHASISGFSHFRGNGPVRAEDFLTGGTFKVFDSTLDIRGWTTFTGNSGTYAGAIGGVNADIHLEGHILFSDNRYAGCISLFRSSLTCSGELNFTNNEIKIAEGFGPAIFSENSTISLSGRINFVRNTAMNGVGGAMFTFNSHTVLHGVVLFANNHAAGGVGGAICIDRSSLECNGNITFTDNTAEYRGGGVYAINSKVIVTGNSSFVQNRAVEGGGVGFEGSAELVLVSPVNMKFHRNQAETNGGAILVLDSSSIAQCQNISVERRNCFFQIDSPDTSSMDVRLDFMGNTAMNAGGVLYGGSLQLCRVQVNGEQIDTDSFQYLKSISIFEGSSSDISSDPLKVCFCVGGTADYVNSGIKKISTHRGQLLTLSVIAVGQQDMPVPSTLRGYIENNDETTELVPQSHMINATCTDITFRLWTSEKSWSYIRTVLVETQKIHGGRSVSRSTPVLRGLNWLETNVSARGEYWN